MYNVLVGRRYGQITQEVRDYVRGLYGTPTGPVDPELKALVFAREGPITGRPADLLEPEFAKALAGVREIVPSADDAEALAYAMFPLVYTSYREALRRGLDSSTLTAAALCVVAAFRRPTPSPSPSLTGERPPTGNAWSHEGRVRLQGGGGWSSARATPRRR